MSYVRGNKSARTIGNHGVSSKPTIGNFWISIGLHNFLSNTGEYHMQITLCSIDMRRIVKGLYLLSKKFFIIRIKKLVKKAISQRDLSTSKSHRVMRTTAVQDFSQLTTKIFY